MTSSSRVTPEGGAASCDVRGTITVTKKRSTSVIRFQVEVPEEWNGRYVQVGGGGFCGSIPTASGSGSGYVADGYAVASDDSGHQGSALDGSFASDNPAAELTWGRLSEHLTSVAAKRVAAHLQGSSPVYSYFVGCSTGGRQALVLAQHFPDDFDGIVGDPRQCRVDLTSLRCAAVRDTGCLTDEQVAVLDEWCHSPRASRGARALPRRFASGLGRRLARPEHRVRHEPLRIGAVRRAGAALPRVPA